MVLSEIFSRQILTYSLKEEVMSTTKKKNDMPELKKPSGVIHVDHVLSAPAQRLYNCLLAYVQDDIANVADMPIFQIPSEAVREYMHTRNDDKLKEWLRELRRKDVEFNNLGKGGPSWGCYGFIESPEMKGAYIRFSIAPTLRELMANSSMFAKINMLIERKFKKTKHAQPIYELGLDYRDNKDKFLGKGCTPWMDIKTFKKYMGIDAKSYTNFKILNRDVIQKALSEIKAESDIVMNLDKELESREVVKIRFIIEDNKSNMSAAERIKRLQQTLPIHNSKAVEQEEYAQVMHSMFEVSLGRARKIAKLYIGHRDALKANCEKIERYKMEGRVKGKIGPFAARILIEDNPIASISESQEDNHE